MATSVLILSGGALAGERPISRLTSDDMWRDTPSEQAELTAAAPVAREPARWTPASFRSIALDWAELESRLGLDGVTAVSGRQLISLPMPDGTLQEFEVTEQPIMAPALAARFPEVRTFLGSAVGRSPGTAQITILGKALHAQVLAASNVVLVEPLGAHYASFERASNHVRTAPLLCQVQNRAVAALHPVASAPLPDGATLRTVRLAIAATSGYVELHGGTVRHALGAVALTVARVDQIYRRDLGLRLELVANNDQLIFEDPTSDPFAGIDGDTELMAPKSQEVIARVLGETNFDAGQTFGVGNGSAGLAAAGACRPGMKADAATVSDNPQGDPFNVDFVAHELAHQFGADHTFNGGQPACSAASRAGGFAFEPGSGSTILGYPGACGFDDLQEHSDPYFHSASIQQVAEYVDTHCGGLASTLTSNRSPTVDAGQDLAIPVATAFTLRATASDPDGDLLTYTWEQMDLGPQATLAARDDGQGPLFRSLPPKESDSRDFPSWANLVNGSSQPGDRLPEVARTATFRVTVRDGRGGVAMDEVTVQMVAQGGAFRVISPQPSRYSGLLPVIWRVARTDQPPVGSSRVDLDLTVDGANSFSEAVWGTPNDGGALVALPNQHSSLGRLQAAGVDNIFYALSRSHFTIEPYRTVAVVVSHAEEDSNGADPSLTPQGEKRASALADLLAAAQIDSVLVQDTARSRGTAAPFAQLQNLPVITYADPSDLMSRIAAAPRPTRCLVIGDAQILPEIVERLGGSRPPTIRATEYSHLFLVSQAESGSSARRFLYSISGLEEFGLR